MIEKRVVLRHATGLRQILGVLTVESDKHVPLELHGIQIDQVTCSTVALHVIKPRYLVYEERERVSA